MGCPALGLVRVRDATGGGPDLQHVVWRRTVFFPDGRIIQDLPVTKDISRNRMFCPIGFTGDVRTTFWSYADPVRRAACNALMRPNVYNDENSRTVQVNDSAMTEYIVIADDNPMKKISHVSQKSRNPSYSLCKIQECLGGHHRTEKAILRVHAGAGCH